MNGGNSVTIVSNRARASVRPFLFDADMAKMADDPKTQKWWDIMKPMQQPLETRAEGEWWANMEEVFHTD